MEITEVNFLSAFVYRLFNVIQIYSGITSGTVLDGDIFMKISLHSSGSSSMHLKNQLGETRHARE